MEVILRLAGPGQELFLGAPLRHSHEANRQLPRPGPGLRVGVADGAADGRAARRVGEPDVHHVADGHVAVAEPVGAVPGVDPPAGFGRRRRQDQEARVLCK